MGYGKLYTPGEDDAISIRCDLAVGGVAGVVGVAGNGE